LRLLDQDGFSVFQELPNGVEDHEDPNLVHPLRGLKLAALAIGTSFVLAGCAGNPPTEQYAVTQSAVNSAVSAGGTEFAAVEMKRRRTSSSKPKSPCTTRSTTGALAEQAEWDARVAERKAQAMKAEQAVKDSRKVFRNCVRKASAPCSKRA
jgi:hypothetical protein